MFKLTKVYTDENGDSRFEDVEIALEDAGEIGALSRLIPARCTTSAQRSTSASMAAVRRSVGM